MAEFQTISATIAVAQLAWHTCVIFKKVKDADVTAKRLYQKTRQLHALLRDIEATLRWRKDQRQEKTLLSGEAQIEQNIRASIEASRQVLFKIDKKLKPLNGKEELPLSSKAWAQVQLILKEPAILRHESDLDVQIQALQTSLGVLQLFGHAETQSELHANHGQILLKLAMLDKAIKRANTRLLTLSPRKPRSPHSVEVDCAFNSNVNEFRDTEACEGIQTLKDCISMAENVRDTFGSHYDPDGRSLKQFSDYGSDVWEDEPYDDSDLDNEEPGNYPKTSSSCVGLDKLVGHPNPDHDESTPLEVLSSLIDDLKEHAQKDLEAGNPRRAEVKLVEAIKHAEERQSKHKIPFEDRVEMQETLAVIYQKQKKWAEAKKVLHPLLQDGNESESKSTNQKVLQHSRQYFLLATVHFDMHKARSDNKNPREDMDLLWAERFAKLAFSKRYKLLEATVGRHDTKLLEYVTTLIEIYEAQGRTALAESYRRQFVDNCDQIDPLPEERRPSISGATGSDFDVIEVDDLLISAIKTGDKVNIQSLVTTANVNCRCPKGKTPLMYSVEQEDEVTIRKLLDHGAEINAITPSRSTALHQAVIKGNVHMARLLLELDADIEAKDKNLATPLVKAVEKNHGLLVSSLLGQGANVHVKDKAGWTLLHHAAHNGAVDVLKHLLYPSHQIDINATCPAGKTALHYCAELTLIEPARILLSRQANVNALDVNSRSPLFFAVNKPSNEKREQFLTLLLENGAQIDPARLPPRQRDYPALQNYPENVFGTVSPSSRRRESASTVATSASTRTSWSFLRRLSLNTKQG